MTNNQLENLISLIDALQGTLNVMNFSGYELLTQQLIGQAWRLLDDAKSELIIIRHFGDLEDDNEESLN